MPNVYRSTMTDLVARLRSMTGAPAGTFTDLQCQDFLDGQRSDVRLWSLTPDPSFDTSGTMQWFHYYAGDPQAPTGFWEATAVLQGPDWATLSPATSSNLLQGHWVFTASTTPPVYLTGSCYDLAAAAADLCDAWSTQLALAYQVASDGQTLMRQQMPDRLSQRAERFRAQARGRTLAGYRSDLEAC